MKQIKLKIFLWFFFPLSVLAEESPSASADSLAPLQIRQSLSSEGPYGNFDLQDVPVSASDYSEQTLQKFQVQQLSDITALESAASDAYSANGYWDSLAVRGFILDPKFSFFREGLPISAETSIALDNKAQVQILKGLSALQNGTASPGGAINYVVKRPTLQSFEKLQSSFSEESQFLVGYERSRHLSQASKFSYHLQAVHENLGPAIQNSHGTRHFVSTAWDYRHSDHTLVQAELEWSKRSQPSQAGFSLLGNRLPIVKDPSRNLNNQPWSQPVVMEGLTGSLLLKQSLNPKSDWSVSWGVQRLHSDDRLAYAYGCSLENIYDRFCSNGDFDVYDYRSENERRTTRAARFSWNQRYETDFISHQLTFGVLSSQTEEDYQKQAYNFVGVDNVDRPTNLPENRALTDESTLRNSKQSEFSLLHVSKMNTWEVWWGLRQVQISRHTIRTDGSRQTDLGEDFLLKNGALVKNFAETKIYVSYGEGQEAAVVPNRTEYNRPGTYLQGYRSLQYEVGLKRPLSSSLEWSAAVFQIVKPLLLDLQPNYLLDGEVRHQGVEIKWQQQVSRWDYGVSGMLLKAEQQGSTLAANRNGLRPVNVPQETLRSFLEYRLRPTWILMVHHSYEGSRAVTADNSILLSGWQKWDLGARYGNQQNFSVQVYIENIQDNKYWQESPTQYGHIYLYPGKERSISVTASYQY